jgi:hypothetical protein
MSDSARPHPRHIGQDIEALLAKVRVERERGAHHPASHDMEAAAIHEAQLSTSGQQRILACR